MPDDRSEIGGYSVVLYVKGWDPEIVSRGVLDMHEAAAKLDLELDDYDVEWVPNDGETEEPKPTAAMWDSLHNLDVGMGRENAANELTEAEGWDDSEASWILRELDRRGAWTQSASELHEKIDGLVTVADELAEHLDRLVEDTSVEPYASLLKRLWALTGEEPQD